MGFVLGGVLIAILFGMIIGSARRDRERDAKGLAVRDRLSVRYKPDEVFVSPFDQSAIGVCRERGTLVLADSETDAEYPFSAIAELEGIRDGIVIRRTVREGSSVTPPLAPKGDVVTVRSLELRLTVDDPARPVWLVRFFDWPGGGVSPGNIVFQERARETEHWFALVADATRGGAP